MSHNKSEASLFEQILTRSRRYTTAASWLLSAVETVAALVAGGFVGAAISGQDVIFQAVLSSLLYLVFFLFKLYAQNLFPSALFGELQSQEQLRRAEAELQRRKVIFSYLDAAIERLNQQTCSIAEQTHDLCRKAVNEGLTTLLEPLITRPQYILACDSSRFTVAARVAHTNEKGEWTQHFVVFRDDLSLAATIGADEDGVDVLEDSNATGIRFQLRNALQSAYNHNEFHVQTIRQPQSTLSVVASPIPLICESNAADGVLVLISEQLHQCPVDMSDVLRIYGRLIANWLAKYSECMNSRLKQTEHGNPTGLVVDLDALEKCGLTVSACTTTTPDPHALHGSGLEIKVGSPNPGIVG